MAKILGCQPARFVPEMTAKRVSSEAKHFDPQYGFDRQVTIKNHTDVKLHVMYRDGVHFTMHPEPATGKPLGFTVTVSYRVGKQVDINSFGTLSAPEGVSKSTEAFKDAVANARVMRDGSRMFVVEYAMTLKDFRYLDSTMYLTELDLLISSYTGDEMGVHPYAAFGRQLMSLVTDEYVNTDEGFGYRIEIVDNEGKYGRKFFNLNGEVYQVQPVKNPWKKDGIYVTSTPPRTNDGLPTPPSVNYYPFTEDMTKINLYPDAEEATTYGNVKDSREKDLAKKIHQQKEEETQRRRDMEAEKARWEREKFERERTEREEAMRREEARNRENEKLAELKHQREMLARELEMNSMKAKEHYEQKSHRRRNVVEATRVLPAILTLVGGVVGYFLTGKFGKLKI